MSCDICGATKAANCDCTKEERAMYDEMQIAQNRIAELEAKIEQLKAIGIFPSLRLAIQH